MYRRNQTDFVSTNVKNRQFPNFVSSRKYLTNFFDRSKIILLHLAIPTGKSVVRLGIFRGKLVQPLSGDDVHTLKALNIFPRHLFQLRIRRDDVQHRLHIAVGVFVIDNLFEIERPPLDLVGERVFELAE